MKEAIYKAEISTPFGIFLAAVLEVHPFAKETISNLVQSELKISFGSFRVREVKKSNRKILQTMNPVKGAYDSRIGQWGWLKRISS